VILDEERDPPRFPKAFFIYDQRVAAFVGRGREVMWLRVSVCCLGVCVQLGEGNKTEGETVSNGLPLLP